MKKLMFHFMKNVPNIDLEQLLSPIQLEFGNTANKSYFT